MSEASGATSTEISDGGANGKPDTVPKADHQRVLDDMMKFKKNFNDAAKENGDLKARLEALEKTKSETTGDFKSLYEKEKIARDELNGKYEGLKSSMVLTEKYKAASAALIKAGMNPEAMKLLDKEDFNEIEVEATSQGRFIPHGVDLYVDKFKKEFPFAFQTGKPPTMNGGGGSGGTTTSGEDVTPAKLFEIEQECKKKKDMKPYYEALEKYKKSKQKNVS